jgi:hypothetical protein
LSERWQSSTFTTEFGREFEAERAEWLRARFLWYTAIVGGFNVLVAMVDAISYITAAAHETPTSTASAGGRTLSLTELLLTLISVILYGGVFVHVKRQGGTRAQLLRLVMLLIVANGFLQLLISLVGMRSGQTTLSVGQVWIASIFFSHLLACMFLPLTPRESFLPILPLLVVNAIFALVSSDPWWKRCVAIGLSPLVGVPGAAICWWRHSRFRDRFTMRVLRGRYAELKAELTNARTIHESLFPRPCTHGPVRFSYVYEPMRQIGGDYLYACFTPGAGGQRALNIAVIDVTGHGIPAALTVNRLHGELERIFAEHPDAGPGDVLTLLNRYVHLTLATHSVYVTAVCFRVDPGTGKLEYASGGHPPAFLRAVDGTVEQLDSTTFVLGACAALDFRAEPRSLPFTPGDTLIAYTDGATEARDARGKFLGVKGIQKVIALSRPDLDGGWPSAILRTVEQHRQGPAADDTLVIEIVRPLDVDQTRTSVSSPKTDGVRAAAATR